MTFTRAPVEALISVTESPSPLGIHTSVPSVATASAPSKPHPNTCGPLNAAGPPVLELPGAPAHRGAAPATAALTTVEAANSAPRVTVVPVQAHPRRGQRRDRI